MLRESDEKSLFSISVIVSLNGIKFFFFYDFKYFFPWIKKTEKLLVFCRTMLLSL